MEVRNMTSAKGNKIANQFIIEDDELVYFQSYNSIIVKKDLNNMRITLDRNRWDYSVTTSKYRNMFLGETKSDTERKIKSGEYILADLNQ